MTSHLLKNSVLGALLVLTSRGRESPPYLLIHSHCEPSPKSFLVSKILLPLLLQKPREVEIRKTGEEFTQSNSLGDVWLPLEP